MRNICSDVDAVTWHVNLSTVTVDCHFIRSENCSTKVVKVDSARQLCKLVLNPELESLSMRDRRCCQHVANNVACLQRRINAEMT